MFMLVQVITHKSMTFNSEFFMKIWLKRNIFMCHYNQNYLILLDYNFMVFP